MKLTRSGLIGLALSLSIVAACEDKTDIVIPDPPDPPLTLNLVPDHLDLFVGQTGQLVAVVSGGAEGTARTATCTSSNNDIATVDANTCAVTGVAPGNAQITARATADNSVADVSTVAVTEDPANVPPTISIKSVTQGNTNTPVQIGNVQGQIDITANLDVPPGAAISAVEWLIDDTVVCRQEFSGGAADLIAAAEEGQAADEAQAAVELVCSVNTAAFDAETGAVTFPNGPHQIRVRVIGAQGTVVAESPPTQFSTLMFNNLSFLSIAATGANSAADQTGLLWQGGGPLTVRVLPVLFTEGTLTNVTVTVSDDSVGGSSVGTVSQTTAVSEAGPVNVVFPTSGANNIAGFEEPKTIIKVNSIQGGQQGPSDSTLIRLDVVAPTISAGPVLPPPSPTGESWLGASSPAFTTAGFGVTATDGGVNVNTLQIETRPFGSPAGTAWTAHSSAASIGETNPSALEMRAVVCDALQNCANSGVVGPFGVDLTAPTITADATPPDSINPTTPYTVTGADPAPAGLTGASGFPANFVQVQIVKTSTAGTQCVSAAGVLSAPPAAGCPFFEQGTTDVTVPPAAGEGYFTITIRLTDAAGNVSTTVEDLQLVDATPPSATVPNYSETATTVTIGGTVTDNVDLRSWDVSFGFGATVLPFSTPTVVGEFGLPLVTSVPAGASSPLIRSLQTSLGGGITNVDRVGFGVMDVAENYAFGSRALIPGVAPDGVSTTNFTSFTTTASPTTVCRTGTAAACTAAFVGNTSTTVTATAVGNLDFVSPLTAVHFYVQHPTAGNWIFVGTDNAPDLVVPSATNERNYIFELVVPAAAFPGRNLPTTVNVLAVGLDADGDALSSNAVAIDVR